MNQPGLTAQPPAREVARINRVLRAGLLSGLAAAVLALLWNTLRVMITGQAYQELNVGSIVTASILPSMLGAAIYWGLSRRTSRAPTVFRAIGAAFAALSTVPQFIEPLHPGFAMASAPLHLIVGLTAVWLIPRLSHPSHPSAPRTP